jgi:hypothetical protein
MNSGWRCPGCGKCYSPLTPQCFTCGQPTYTSNQTDWTKAASFTVMGKACNRLDCDTPSGGYCFKCDSEKNK